MSSELLMSRNGRRLRLRDTELSNVLSQFTTSWCLPWPRLAGTCPGWPGGWWSSPCPGPGPPSPPRAASAPPLVSSGLDLDLSGERAGRQSRLKHQRMLVKRECSAQRLKYLFFLYFIICNLSRKLFSKSDKRNLLTEEFIKYITDRDAGMQRKFREIFKYNLYIYWNFQPWIIYGNHWSGINLSQPCLEIKVKSFEITKINLSTIVFCLMSGIQLGADIKRINLI